MPNAAVESPVSLDVARSKKLLTDMKANPFVAIVVYPDGKVSVASTAGPEHLERISEALTEHIAERINDAEDQ